MWLLYVVLGVVATAFLYRVMVRGDVYFARGDPVGRAFDEGVNLDAATRVLAGQVPYRDFSLIYAPGQSYALAAVFLVAGPSMVAERKYDLVVRALLCLSVYALAREVSSSKVALIPYAVAMIGLGSAYFYAYPMFPALLLAFSSATACLISLRMAAWRWLFVAGMFAGGAGLFRHDVGIYLIGSEAALLLMWGIAGMFHPGEDAVVGFDTIARFRSAVGFFLAGVGAVVALPAAYLLANVPFAGLWYAFVAFPLSEFRSSFAVPVPDPTPSFGSFIQGTISWSEMVALYRHSPEHLLWVNFWTQPVIVGAGLLAVTIGLWALRRGLCNGATVWDLALVTFLSGAFFNQAINRADPIHLLPSSILTCILVCALGCRGFALRRLRVITLGAVLLAALIMMPSYVQSPLSTVRAAHDWGERVSCADNAELARSACVFIFPKQAEAAVYIRMVTGPDEPIFVGNAQHDRHLPNDALFYFIAARPNATRYDDLIAGLVATPGTQARIIADLEGKHVRWIVLSSMFKDESEPNSMGRPTGITALDEYIQANYEPVRSFDEYVIWMRR
jgi:hypothetical protein